MLVACGFKFPKRKTRTSAPLLCSTSFVLFPVGSGWLECLLTASQCILSLSPVLLPCPPGAISIEITVSSAFSTGRGCLCVRGPHSLVVFTIIQQTSKAGSFSFFKTSSLKKAVISNLHIRYKIVGVIICCLSNTSDSTMSQHLVGFFSWYSFVWVKPHD